jgi:serine/threonine protein kinase
MVNHTLKSHYETIAPLGRGGMGEVFLAAMPGPPGLNQLAVLKRIWPELAAEPEFVAMFMDEARLALRMRHENIVQTFEVGREAPRHTQPGAGSEPDRYYIAMEYLAGQTLAHASARLASGDVFGIQLRLQIVADILSALDYAHQLRGQDGAPLGVVHRDISPQNVFITYQGGVKLMDFGVAKSLGASHQTRPGTFKGRFAYAAPEQIRGAKVDRRSDLFSVGIILWELLTEQHLFRGRSRSDIVRILTGRDRLPALPADWPIPERLRFVIARALALQPSARYQTAAAFRQDLLDIQTNWLPPDPRPLAKVISCAFAPERESIEKLIAHYFDVNDEALTRVPLKRQVTQSQLSMPALWGQGAAPAAVPQPPAPATPPPPAPARVAPPAPVAAARRHRDSGVDHVPLLESAKVSLLTWYSKPSRLAPSDTIIDGSGPRAQRAWQWLSRSRLACAAAGLGVGALFGFILLRAPDGGGAAIAAVSPGIRPAVQRPAAASSAPVVEPIILPPAAAPAATPPAAPALCLPIARPMKAAAMLATNTLPPTTRARPSHLPNTPGAADKEAAPDLEGPAAEASVRPTALPARIGRPALDTENPWGR